MNKAEVINLIDMLGSRIGAPYDSRAYPYIYDSFEDVWNDGTSIYIDGNGDIHFVAFDRGRLVFDKTDPDPIMALYPVLRGEARSQAFDYARAHSVRGRDPEGRDYRRMWFEKELELLSRVLPLYAEMDAKYIHDLLQDNPFMDGKPIGDFLDKYLGRGGVTRHEISHKG